MIDSATAARVERFLRGEEVALSTAREMVGDLYSMMQQANSTLRDQFASAALVHAMTSEDGEQAAKDAYRIADAMLKVREMRS